MSILWDYKAYKIYVMLVDCARLKHKIYHMWLEREKITKMLYHFEFEVNLNRIIET